MKRLYTTRVEKGENFSAYEYQVVAANGQEAARKAVTQAKRDSGYKTGWRVTSVLERAGYVIS